MHTGPVYNVTNPMFWISKIRPLVIEQRYGVNSFVEQVPHIGLIHIVVRSLVVLFLIFKKFESLYYIYSLAMKSVSIQNATLMLVI